VSPSLSSSTLKKVGNCSSGVKKFLVCHGLEGGGEDESSVVCLCVMDSGALGFWDTKTHTCFHQAPLLSEPLGGVALAGDCVFLKRGDERKKGKKLRREKEEGSGDRLERCEGGSKKKKKPNKLAMGILLTGTEKGKIALWQLFMEHPFVSLFYQFELDFPISSLCVLSSSHQSPLLNVWVSSLTTTLDENKTGSGGGRVQVVTIGDPGGTSDPITTYDVEGCGKEVIKLEVVERDNGDGAEMVWGFAEGGEVFAWSTEEKQLNSTLEFPPGLDQSVSLVGKFKGETWVIGNSGTLLKAKMVDCSTKNEEIPQGNTAYHGIFAKGNTEVVGVVLSEGGQLSSWRMDGEWVAAAEPLTLEKVLLP